MSLGKYKILGYCCAKLNYEPQDLFFNALCDAVKGTDYKIIAFTTSNDFYENNADGVGAVSVFDVIDYDSVDLMVFSPMSFVDKSVCRKIVDGCNKSGTPVIALEDCVEGSSVLRFDTIGSFEKIARHIIEFHGCKIINIMAGQYGNKYSNDRIDIVRKVMAENGLELEDSRILYGDFWADPTERELNKFLDSGQKLPDAIICCNDSMAITVCTILANRGISVPDDVMVTGFDGIVFERVSSPRLTTASVNVSAVSEYIHKLLVEGNIKINLQQENVIPNLIRYSESCGCKEIDSLDRTTNITSFYNKYQNLYNYQMYLTVLMNAMTEDGNFAGLYDRIKTLVLENCSICLNDDVYVFCNAKQKCDNDNMNVFLSRGDGRTFYDNGSFEKKQMIPDYQKVFERTDYVIIVPIHFLDHCYGYIIKEPSNGLLNFDMLFMFENSFEQGLEMILRHERLDSVNRQLNRLYLQDPMTKIFNRRGFYVTVSAKISSCPDSQIAIIGFDMDGLKNVNDNFGHICGDRALMAISDAMSNTQGYDAVCARFGGDEFITALIYNGADSIIDDYIADVVENLKRYNEENSEENGFVVELSYGFTHGKASDIDDIETLIIESDKMMYIHKAKRKALKNKESQ